MLVVVTGEFGRTPRISLRRQQRRRGGERAAGTVQPGRDHWPRANSMIWAGGGIATGQVIGAPTAGRETSSTAASARRLPGDDLPPPGHRLYQVTIPDRAGRPTPIVTHGQAIPELIGRS